MHLINFDSFFLIYPKRFITKSTEFVDNDEQIPISKFPLSTLTPIFH